MKKNLDYYGLFKPNSNWHKLLLTMKISAFLLFYCLANIFAVPTYSQSTKITLNLKDATIDDVLSKIEDISEFYFLFNHKLIDVNRKVNIDADKEPIKNILNDIFNDDIKFIVYDRQIILTPNDPTSVSAAMQQLKITGTVVDQNGSPYPGVNVIITGTTQGTLTDIAGKYSIEISQGAKSLTFSFVGMEPQEISIGKLTQINVTMIESEISLEEVVVIGYGTSKKSDLVAAISSVEGDELTNIVAPSVGQMLQGKAAGLVININSAQPGGGFSFNIRGLASVGLGNEPLIIVDGYAISNLNINPVAATHMYGPYPFGSVNTFLSSVNPNDIESIEVLKDASATAIYGARAGHGVILITTKRGKTGKMKVEFNTSMTSQILRRKPHMLNGKDYMIQGNLGKFENYMLTNKIFPYGTKMFSEVSAPFVPAFSQEAINTAETTDWFDLVTRKGSIQQHNLSLKGGTDATRFMFSTNFYRNDGVVKNNSFQRFTGRLNIDNKFGKYTTGGISLMLSQLTNDNIIAAISGNTAEWGVIGNALGFAPYLPVRQPNGEFTINPDYPLQTNPVSLLDVTNVSTTGRVLTNSFLQVEPIEGLVFKGTIGFDYQTGQGNYYLPTTTLYGAKVGGQANKSLQNAFNWQYEGTMNYIKTFADAHNVSLLLGYSQQEFKDDFFNAGNQQFITDAFLYNNLGQGASERPDVNSSASKHAIAGYFTRVSYNFKNKYYFTGTVRRDGSSDFAKNYKWGVFPSLAAAWKINEESFMKGIDILSLLKLRTSWGQTGNAGLGGRAKAYYGSSGKYVFGEQTIDLGMALIQLANLDLKWETTTEINFGLDIGIFKNRITLTGDYFHRVISDLMSTIALPNYLEISSVAANVGETQSDGFEITLNTVNFDKADFSWNSTFTASYYYDRWKKRAETWTPNAWESVDDPLRLSAGYLYDGLIQFGDIVPWIIEPYPGRGKALDIDGFLKDAEGNVLYDQNSKRALKTGEPDGKLDAADIRIWHVDKPYYIGFTNTFKYKMFDLSVYTYGVFNIIGSGGGALGRDMWQEALNVLEASKNTWAHDNLTGSPWINPPSAINRKYQQLGLQNTSFLRIKSVMFGITVPKKALPSYIGSVRVYFDVSNLYIFTKYLGMDPETPIGSRGGYPNPRSFSCGINVDL